MEGFDNWPVPVAGRVINAGAEQGGGTAQTTMVVSGRENDWYALWHAEQAGKANRATVISGIIDRASGAQVTACDVAQAVPRSN